MLFLLASIMSQLSREFTITIVDAVVPNVEPSANQLFRNDKTDSYVVVTSGNRECGRTKTINNSLRPYWQHTIDCGCLPHPSRIKVCFFDVTHNILGDETGPYEIGCIDRLTSYYLEQSTGSNSGSTAVRDGLSFHWKTKVGLCARPPSPPRPAVEARAASSDDEAGGGANGADGGGDEADGGGDEADGGGNGVAPIVGGVVGVCAVLCIGAKLRKKKKDARTTTSGTKSSVAAPSSV